MRRTQGDAERVEARLQAFLPDQHAYIFLYVVFGLQHAYFGEVRDVLVLDAFEYLEATFDVPLAQFL